jgi:squalene-hopene/tetraprenyl-beta-curcumene cyclase
VAFVTERLNGEDGLGAIYPAMANSVMMFDALGYAPEHPDRAIARQSVANLVVVREDEAYCQPCVSPVWDTALAVHALMEAGGEAAEAEALRGLDWLKPRQVLDVKGDWAGERPDVRPGGWAFQYNNPHYPDTDDTAVVVMAMDRARTRLGAGTGYDEAISRGAEWIEGLQSKNGGWGAFDADNTYHYLNNIPFADHGALLDPPTVDVAARCVSMLAQLGEAKDSPRMAHALAYLEREQELDGSWFGRWGVNYIYGTWSALCALNAAGVDPNAPVVRKAVDWLAAIQNADGGWGEDCESYALDYRGYKPFASNPTQTAWALIGLMAVGDVDHPAVARGLRTPTRAAVSRGSSICATTAIRSSSRSGRWPATAISNAPTTAKSPSACDDPGRHRPEAGAQHPRRRGRPGRGRRRRRGAAGAGAGKGGRECFGGDQHGVVRGAGRWAETRGLGGCERGLI